ncbi:protein-glutamate O-methyltransferase CheR [Chitinibacter tainanensis]|uniref:CheR family methyltransferase n=1 Tax=Chitinibacter tainanensis TaxID=230667 RepID=UPI0023530F01|nr:CheR family methyltransferase [Chitinibacter tainanensis]
MPVLTDATFVRYQQWLRERTGVNLTEVKKTLVHQRLIKRLQARNIDTFEAYFRVLLASSEEAERQLALDLLTTHETYFFREPKHFQWFKHYLLSPQAVGRALRVWSAASSSGEEVWSIAMMLSDFLGLQGTWYLLGSDISQPVLAKAQQGHYPMSRCEGIPPAYLRDFCLKGQGAQLHTLRIMPALRKRVDFRLVNLNEALPDLGHFDVIFLRNVLIYFDIETKNTVLLRCIDALQPGGYLLVSHSESLTGFQLPLDLVQAGIYRKRA